MKRALPVFLVICMFLTSLKAQITTLPATETFSSNFTIGNNIDFIPNWFGNEVDVGSRIFQTPEKEMGLIPTSSFDPDVQVRLNLSSYSNISVSFKARSEKNGEGNRASLLYMETSTDGGISWNTRKLIHSFANEDRSYSNYIYYLPGSAGGRGAIVVRFWCTRGDGDGTAARVIIDDATFDHSSQDITAPEVAAVEVISAQSVRVRFNERMGESAVISSNYTGLPNLTEVRASLDRLSVVLSFEPNFGIGVFRTLTVSNVADEAGNRISAPYSAQVVFNNTRPDIVVTEIMYNPPEEDVDSLEFLEIYNRGSAAAILGGLYFSSGITMTLPEKNLAPGEYLLLAVNAAAAKKQYGADFLQWESGALNNAGESIEIKNSLDQVVYAITYERTWGGDGDGRSLVLCYPSSGADVASNWSSATTPAGGLVNGQQIYAHPGKGCADPDPELRFTATYTYAIEGAKKILINVISVNPNTSVSEVTMQIDEASTAQPGIDLTSEVTFPYKLTFPPGTRMRTVTIQVLDDEESEKIERLIFRLTDPVNAVIGSTGAFTIDILDNDAGITEVCINELVASNNVLSGIRDEFGEADDWLELKNGSDEPVVLGGYYLTDNPDNLTKHRIPTEDLEAVTISPKGYLIFWADNQSNQGPRHLDFALSASGEYLALVMPDGTTIVDEVYFPSLSSNTSYGRANDCADNWVVFQTPTHGSSNKPTSVVYRDSKTPLILYPNPVSGSVIYISEPVSYHLYDTFGRYIQSARNTNQVKIGQLTGGMYILVTEEGDVARFIVNR